MKILFLNLILAISFAPHAKSFASSKTINVSLEFVEALSPKDTTSSERFQKEFENAISLGKKLTSKKLEACGYSLTSKSTFFDASDALQALEKAKSAEAAQTWMIVGPRRSNHYVLLSKGAANTPTVSTMASSDEVVQLAPMHLSVVSGNKEMASAAAKEAKIKLRNKPLTYMSVVSEDCVACVDFSTHFDLAAKKLGLKKLKEIKVAGETPSTEEAQTTMKALRPTFVLVPNFSKIAAIVLAALHKVDSQAFYVGGDGWGDSKFGFLQDAKDLEGIDGITVRGFPKTEYAISQLKIARLATDDDSLPSSGPTVSVLRIIEGAADLLCDKRPKTRDEFIKTFKSKGGTYFKPIWGVSIYTLKSGNIEFQKKAGSQ